MMHCLWQMGNVVSRLGARILIPNFSVVRLLVMGNGDKGGYLSCGVHV